MSLTGQGILWVLGALTIGLPLLTVVLWSRLSRRHVLTVAGRAGLIVASQLVTVALVAVSVNDYAYLYGSWTEVWRSFTQPFDAHYRVSPLTLGHVAGRVTVGGVSQIQPVGPYGKSSRWSKVGRLVTARINGGYSQLSEDAYVYLPPEYFQARYGTPGSPAVEMLSGYPSTNAMLVQRLAFQVQLLHQIRQHRAQPMVLVMLRPIVTYPRDTECTNVPAWAAGRDVLQPGRHRRHLRDYRVTPTGWGVMGMSTGGYCATKILMDYPALFSAGVSLSGYYHALQDYTTGNLWGGSLVLKQPQRPRSGGCGTSPHPRSRCWSPRPGRDAWSLGYPTR